MRGLWTAREHVQHLQPLILAVFVDRYSQNGFVARLVFSGIEEKSSAQFRLLNSPAGKYPCDFGDVVLCVAPINAEGMQFHQLTGVVFVESLLLLWLVAGFWIFATVCNQRVGAYA